ncbi:hypothetical protein Tco_1138995, partial [Tanacetum coccineum]
RESGMSTCSLSHCSGVSGRAAGMSTCPLSHCSGVPDTIVIGVDVIHPVPVAPVVFPAATVVMTLAQHMEAIRGIQEHLLEVPIQEELWAQRDRVDAVEVESASLRATIRTMGAVETVLHNRMRDERQTRIKIERQLASVHESHRQDREDFKKLKEFMTSQYGYRS